MRRYSGSLPQSRSLSRCQNLAAAGSSAGRATSGAAAEPGQVKVSGTRHLQFPVACRSCWLFRHGFTRRDTDCPRENTCQPPFRPPERPFPLTGPLVMTPRTILLVSAKWSMPSRGNCPSRSKDSRARRPNLDPDPCLADYRLLTCNREILPSRRWRTASTRGGRPPAVISLCGLGGRLGRGSGSG